MPRAIDQVADGGRGLPHLGRGAAAAADESTGFRHESSSGSSGGWRSLPSGEELVDPALEVTLTAFEVAVGIFFVLACAAYWIFERERAVTLVTSLLPRPTRKKVVRDTWDLIDLKLGAYVRGQAILIVLVGTVLSLDLPGRSGCRTGSWSAPSPESSRSCP